MGSLGKLTLGVAFGGLMLAAPQPGFAVDFYVNACCLNTAPAGNGGEMKTVSSHVGANAQYSSTVRVTLQVTGPNGFQCTETGERAGSFHPALTMPVRFQVTYPAPALHPGARPRGTVKYTVKATIAKITPPVPSGDVPGNNHHEYSYDLPGGGTPECVKLPGPN